MPGLSEPMMMVHGMSAAGNVVVHLVLHTGANIKGCTHTAQPPWHVSENISGLYLYDDTPLRYLSARYNTAAAAISPPTIHQR